MLQPISCLLLRGVRNNAFILLPGRVLWWGELLAQGVGRDLHRGCSIILAILAFLSCFVTILYLKATENRVFAYKNCSHICQIL